MIQFLVFVYKYCTINLATADFECEKMSVVFLLCAEPVTIDMIYILARLLSTTISHQSVRTFLLLLAASYAYLGMQRGVLCEHNACHREIHVFSKSK